MLDVLLNLLGALGFEALSLFDDARVAGRRERTLAERGFFVERIQHLDALQRDVDRIRRAQGLPGVRVASLSTLAIDDDALSLWDGPPRAPREVLEIPWVQVRATRRIRGPLQKIAFTTARGEVTLALAGIPHDNVTEAERADRVLELVARLVARADAGNA